MQLNYIGNASQASASGLFIPVIDPSDGQPYDQIQRSNADDIDAAVTQNHRQPECGPADPAGRGRAALPGDAAAGWKSPLVVFVDADLDAALPTFINATVQNAGQTVPVMNRLAHQEIFGPVLCAMHFRGEDEAVEMANATPFGGVKSSGYGREKGFEALYGFTTLKTVAFKHD